MTEFNFENGMAVVTLPNVAVFVRQYKNGYTATAQYEDFGGRVTRYTPGYHNYPTPTYHTLEYVRLWVDAVYTLANEKGL